jgi:hypothetical protein
MMMILLIGLYFIFYRKITYTLFQIIYLLYFLSLNYRYTVAILVTFAFIVSNRQFGESGKLSLFDIKFNNIAFNYFYLF